MNKRPNKKFAILAMLFVIALAFAARHVTFWLPHWQGDQSQYLMLAMKLAKTKDFTHYNLNEVNVEYMALKDKYDSVVAYPYHAPGSLGQILKSYYAKGIGYYDMPVFYKAPLFPIVLALSHQLFAGGGEHPFAVVSSDLGKNVMSQKPAIYINVQLWAVMVPLLLNFFIIGLVFWWVYRRQHLRAAIYAGFILAMNPVYILTSNRLWTEDLMTTFVLSAMVVFYAAYFKKNIKGLLFSGVLLGLGVLTNQKTLLVFPGLYLFTCLMGCMEKKSWLRTIFNKPFILCSLTALAVAAPWFLKIYSTYGTPFYEPSADTQSLQDWDWYRVLLLRPHGIIFYTFGTVAICWPFFFSYLSIRQLIRSLRSCFKGGVIDESSKLLIFCWSWIAPFAVYFLPNRTGEQRYLHAVYPALAYLAVWAMTRFEERLKPVFRKPWFVYVLTAIFLIAAAWYSLGTVYQSLWTQRNLIHEPWI